MCNNLLQVACERVHDTLMNREVHRCGGKVTAFLLLTELCSRALRAVDFLSEPN